MWIFKKPDRDMFFNWRGYVLGLALVALATWLKYIAQPDIITRPNSLLYILAIVVTAIFYGLGPAIFVSIVSVLIYRYFFRDPVFAITPVSTPDIIVLIIFLITGVIISFLASNLRQKSDEAVREVAARKKSEAELVKYRDHLEDLVKQRTIELEQINGELLTSEEHLKQSQEIAHLGSWELNLGNNTLTWSDEVYRIFGLKPQEFGATYAAFLDAIHPDDRDAVNTAYSSSVIEGRDCYDIEHRIVRKHTGEIRVVHEKCQNIKDDSGKIIRSIGMIQDITERNLLEQKLAKAKDELEIKVVERTQELAESEEKYRLLVENANEVISIVQDGIIKFFGGKAFELTGYLPEEVVSKSFLDVVFSEDREMAAEIYRKYFMEEGVSHTPEFRIVRKDGNIRWTQMNAAKITWEKRPALLAIFTDLTEQKSLEQELKAYAQKITRVQEEERKRIAYELHDDTAQYLSILKLELEALIQSGKVQDPRVLEKLHFLEKDASRAFDDVRRYSHELRPGVLEHLGLQAAVEQIAEDINKLKQIPVEVNVEGSEPTVSEEVKLGFFRIAQEALNNARKHSAATRVIVNLNFFSNQIQMAISDNGTGFDINKAKIKTDTDIRGSMGITSMQERAKLIGADLKIESAPGKGTRVILKINL